MVYRFVAVALRSTTAGMADPGYQHPPESDPVFFYGRGESTTQGHCPDQTLDIIYRDLSQIVRENGTHYPVRNTSYQVYSMIGFKIICYFLRKSGLSS
jgi:hypothetical protein